MDHKVHKEKYSTKDTKKTVMSSADLNGRINDLHNNNIFLAITALSAL